MNAKKIAEALKTIRIIKGYSRKEVAEKVNIHQATLIKYEENAEFMDIGIFIGLLNFYEISYDYFFSDVYDNSLINEIKKEETE